MKLRVQRTFLWYLGRGISRASTYYRTTQCTEKRKLLSKLPQTMAQALSWKVNNTLISSGGDLQSMQLFKLLVQVKTVMKLTESGSHLKLHFTSSHFSFRSEAATTVYEICGFREGHNIDCGFLVSTRSHGLIARSNSEWILRRTGARPTAVPLPTEDNTDIYPCLEWDSNPWF
jgi:hypothetical protein